MVLDRRCNRIARQEILIELRKRDLVELKLITHIYERGTELGGLEVSTVLQVLIKCDQENISGI